MTDNNAIKSNIPTINTTSTEMIMNESTITSKDRTVLSITTPISLSISNDSINENYNKCVNYRFTHVNYIKKSNKSKDKLKQILKDISGEFKFGKLTAILGPSGAGKTSLMNILSGFKSTGVSGQFQINNVDHDLNEIRKICSYIPQNFAMLELLTVYETLKTTADLKLHTLRKRAEKEQLIREIFEILNLNRCSKTLVRYLSGGERKRLSIAIELITNPPIMFFDEPTSGLDSVTSLQIITYLQKIAHCGRCVVCVVHQPNSKLWQLFDDIIVMASGEIFYSGTKAQLLPHFEKNGFQCSLFYNPADFVLEIASEPRINILQLIEFNKSYHNKQFIGVDQASNETTDLLNNISNRCGEIKISYFDAYLPPKLQNSLWHQLKILLKRSIRSMSRNLMAVQLRIVMHIVVAVLLGIVFWKIGNSAAKVLSNISCIFFIVLFVFFGNAMPSIFLSAEDTNVFIREHLNSWYSKRSYYMAKIIADVPLQFLCPTILLTIVYFMTGQPYDIDRFVMCWAMCLLIAIIGHLIGLVFGSIFGVQMGIFLVPSVAIPIMIFSGFFIRLHEVPYGLRPLCDLSFFRFTIEGFMRALYAYDRLQLECLETFCYYKDPNKFLKDYDMLGNWYCIDVIVLFIWIFALQVLYFCSLMWRIKKAR